MKKFHPYSIRSISSEYLLPLTLLSTLLGSPRWWLPKGQIDQSERCNSLKGKCYLNTAQLMNYFKDNLKSLFYLKVIWNEVSRGSFYPGSKFGSQNITVQFGTAQPCMSPKPVSFFKSTSKECLREKYNS